MQEVVEQPKDRTDRRNELYFLIAKFLENGPCKDAAKVLRDEIEKYKLLPNRIDWTGQKQETSFADMERLYTSLPSEYLLDLVENLCSTLDEVCPASEFPTKTRSLLSGGRFSLMRSKSTLNQLKSCQTRNLGITQHQRVAFSHHNNLYPNIVELATCREVSAVGNIRRQLPPRFYAKAQLFRRILGHLSSVYCVLYDKTGRYIFTGADDMLVKVWSSCDGRLLATLRGHQAEITDLALSPDNALLASASCDRVIRVWCLRSLRPVAVLLGHGGTVTSLRFGPCVQENNRNYLVSTSNDGCVCFWEYNRESNAFKPLPTKFNERSRPGAQMICSSFSPGGLVLVTGCTDHVVRVYQVLGSQVPQRIAELDVHTDRVDSIQFANREFRFVTGSKDGTANIWTYRAQRWVPLTLRMTTVLTPKGEGVTSRPCSLSPLEESRQPRRVRMQSETQQNVSSQSRTEHQSDDSSKQKLKVNMVAWTNDDRMVLTAVSNKCIKCWDSTTGELRDVLRGHDDDVFCLESHPYDPRMMISAGHDGRVIIWDMDTGVAVRCFFNFIEGQGHGAVFDCRLSPDGVTFATTDSHGHLSIFGFGSAEHYKKVPEEQFFHTDYRPLIRDAHQNVLDEQTQLAPHLMPPPFLVDIDGNPYPPAIQRFVPGREHCDDSQLVPYVATNEDGENAVQDVIPPNGGSGGVAVGGGGGAVAAGSSPQRPNIDDMIQRLEAEVGLPRTSGSSGSSGFVVPPHVRSSMRNGVRRSGNSWNAGAATTGSSTAAPGGATGGSSSSSSSGVSTAAPPASPTPLPPLAKCVRSALKYAAFSPDEWSREFGRIRDTADAEILYYNRERRRHVSDSAKLASEPSALAKRRAARQQRLEQQQQQQQSQLSSTRGNVSRVARTTRTASAWAMSDDGLTSGDEPPFSDDIVSSDSRDSDWEMAEASGPASRSRKRAAQLRRAQNGGATSTAAVASSAGASAAAHRAPPTVSTDHRRSSRINRTTDGPSTSSGLGTTTEDGDEEEEENGEEEEEEEVDTEIDSSEVEALANSSEEEEEDIDEEDSNPNSSSGGGAGGGAEGERMTRSLRSSKRAAAAAAKKSKKAASAAASAAKKKKKLKLLKAKRKREMESTSEDGPPSSGDRARNRNKRPKMGASSAVASSSSSGNVNSNGDVASSSRPQRVRRPPRILQEEYQDDDDFDVSGEEDGAGSRGGSRPKKGVAPPATDSQESQSSSMARAARAARRTRQQDDGGEVAVNGQMRSETGESGALPDRGDDELPQAFRLPDWLIEVKPRRSPYFPQIGDKVVYFQQGHQLYYRAVKRQQAYRLTKDTAFRWNKDLREQELLLVTDIRYELLPPRLCVLTVVPIDPVEERPDGDPFQIRYHDMPDVIDFMVLKQTYDIAMQRHWKAGDRFGSIIDDQWWTGVIETQLPFHPDFPDSMFQCFLVVWDNGERERMSPWDLEPFDTSRIPDSVGASVDVTDEERERLQYIPTARDFPGGRIQFTARILAGLEKVMTLSIAEPFLVPVDLNAYPMYAMVVAYPIDLSTIRARLENRFYRRVEQLKFDVAFIEYNAKSFNEPRSSIVQKASQLTQLLLAFINDVRCTDALLLYQRIGDTIRSPTRHQGGNGAVVSPDCGATSSSESIGSGPSTSLYSTQGPSHRRVRMALRNGNTGGGGSSTFRQGATAAASLSSSRQRLASPGTSSGTQSPTQNGGASSSRSTDGESKRKHWRQQCAELLNFLLNREESSPFREPVDLEEYPNYLSIIDHPMDLSTAKQRLPSYRDPQEFCKDIRLIFANSKNFNTNKKSRIYSMTVRLSSMFEDRMRVVVDDWRTAQALLMRRMREERRLAASQDETMEPDGEEDEAEAEARRKWRKQQKQRKLRQLQMQQRIREPEVEHDEEEDNEQQNDDDEEDEEELEDEENSNDISNQQRSRWRREQERRRREQLQHDQQEGRRRHVRNGGGVNGARFDDEDIRRSGRARRPIQRMVANGHGRNTRMASGVLSVRSSYAEDDLHNFSAERRRMQPPRRSRTARFVDEDEEEEEEEDQEEEDQEDVRRRRQQSRNLQRMRGNNSSSAPPSSLSTGRRAAPPIIHSDSSASSSLTGSSSGSMVQSRQRRLPARQSVLTTAPTNTRRVLRSQDTPSSSTATGTSDQSFVDEEEEDEEEEEEVRSNRNNARNNPSKRVISSSSKRNSGSKGNTSKEEEEELDDEEEEGVSPRGRSLRKRKQRLSLRQQPHTSDEEEEDDEIEEEEERTPTKQRSKTAAAIIRPSPAKRRRIVGGGGVTSVNNSRPHRTVAASGSSGSGESTSSGDVSSSGTVVRRRAAVIRAEHDYYEGGDRSGGGSSSRSNRHQQTPATNNHKSPQQQNTPHTVRTAAARKLMTIAASEEDDQATTSSGSSRQLRSTRQRNGGGGGGKRGGASSQQQSVYREYDSDYDDEEEDDEMFDDSSNGSGNGVPVLSVSSRGRLRRINPMAARHVSA